MRSILIICLLGLLNVVLAQQPIVRKAAKADTSSQVVKYKIDTPENRWENGVVKNHFLYDSIKNDSVNQDSIRQKKMKAIKRKTKKINKQRTK